MAPRRNITSKNVGAWLGGNKGYVLSGSNTDTSAKADAGGGQAEAVRGELGLGAYTAGIGATAAIGAGVAAVRSGVVASAANKLTGKTVIVHGTPNKLVGNELVPSYGSNAAPHDRVLFGWNPRSQNAKSSLGTSAAQYSRVSGRGPVDESIIPERNVVVAKVKTSATDLGKPGSSKDFIRSTAPAKIVSVVKSPGAPGVTYETYMKELNKALRKAGAPIKGENPVGRMGDRVERIRRQMQYRRNNRNSTA